MPNKVPRTTAEQIVILKNRGMTFMDEAAAQSLLHTISYYRLKGYWWDMQSDSINHTFYPNSIFENIVKRYIFDRELRLILFDAIELIEIALRTKMIYNMAIAHGGLWYLDPSLFMNAQTHAETLVILKNEFANSKEIFAVDFRNRHPQNDPDVWIIFEVASMGTLSKIYKNINHQLPAKSLIANEMGLNLHNELSSWLEAISYIRNIIAHHSRIWSKNMVKRPMQLANPMNQWLQFPITPVQEKKPFYIISAMMYLCNSINPDHTVKKKILDLINDNSDLQIYKLGFFNNWQNEPLWQQ